MKRLGLRMLVAVAALMAADGVVRAGDVVVVESRPMEQTQYWFGVASENIPPAITRQLKLKPGQGLMVVQVLPGSPAARGKIQPEDLLIEVDGQPLMTQEDLVRAANQIDDRGGKMKASKVTLMRDGERMEATLVPAPRPAPYTVVNPNPSFVGHSSASGMSGEGIRTLIAPNGQTISVGNGFSIPLNSPNSMRLRIGQLSKDNIVLSVTTDDAGNKHHSITVGSNTYAVEKEKLDDLPPDIRPLAEQLLKNGPLPMVRGSLPSVEERVAELERSNKELRESNQQLLGRIDELLKRLGEKK
jgi:membrane-associated protease RseP (regulator of RpoE activity)